MATFSQFLKTFDPDSNIKGNQFELFIKWFLKNDPKWSTQVDQIWLWDEYPERWGPDCGIDIIFLHKNSEIWAIQAKCYSPEYSISKSDVDTFLSESNRPEIDKRLLVASTDLIGSNAKRTCDNQEKNVFYLLYSDFERASIDYPEKISKIFKANIKQRPNPLPHQLEALDAVEDGFKNNDRGQLIMACGTGKTYVSLWVKERISANSTLILVPSLNLLSQTLGEWTFAAAEPFEVMCVCSDKTVVKKSDQDELIESVRDFSFPVTSNIEEIRKFLNNNNHKVIFSTYQSSPLITEAQNIDETKSFDLAIADEAHRCTGTMDGTFTSILDGKLIKSKRRLFVTATPRTYKSNIKKRAEERGVEISGMDDESVFGKVFYSLPFGKAIDRELLTDYQVVIIGVNKPMIYSWIKKRELIKTESGEITNAESLAEQIGLFKALKEYDLKRIISFHSRVSRAENFSLFANEVINCIQEDHLPKGVIWTDFVSGKMSSYERKIKLDKLNELSEGDRGLLANARCLSEGVDVPALDGVAFIDPKGSEVDIVQAVGRAIRKSQGKKTGVIFLPVFIQGGQDAESSIDASNFKSFWSVLKALKSHDDILSFELDQLRTNLGRSQNKVKVEGIQKIIIDLPRQISESFSESLNTIIVEKTTESWHFCYGLLCDYFEKNGHSNVPDLFKTEDDFSLGRWVAGQRMKKRKEELSLDKIEKLNELEFVWDYNKDAWETSYAYLKQFYKNNGHSMVTKNFKTVDGFKLGFWVRKQRADGRNGLLSADKMDKFNKLDFVWEPADESWENTYKLLKVFHDEKGHSNVPQDFKTDDGFKLGKWVGQQRTQRRREKLSLNRVEKLNKLDFVWNVMGNTWEIAYEHLKQYFENNGHSNVPMRAKTEDGFSLGSWVVTQRINKESLNTEKIKKLNKLDFVWNVRETAWNSAYEYLKKYYEENGHSIVPHHYKTEDGFKLGSWVSHQRVGRNMREDRAVKLNNLNFVWNTKE